MKAGPKVTQDTPVLIVRNANKDPRFVLDLRSLSPLLEMQCRASFDSCEGSNAIHCEPWPGPGIDSELMMRQVGKYPDLSRLSPGLGLASTLN